MMSVRITLTQSHRDAEASGEARRNTGSEGGFFVR